MLALLLNHFSPLRIQSSPSRTAVVRMPVASEPAARSVIEKQIRRSPLTSGTRNRSFCSAVPWSSKVSMVASCGPMQFIAQAASGERPTSIWTTALASGPRPIPPHSAGMNGHHSPAARALACRSATMAK